MVEFSCEAVWTWAFVCWKISDYTFNFRACDRVLSPNGRGGWTPLRPLSVLQEIRVATREESGVLGFPSSEPWWCLSRGDGRHWASLCTVGMLLVGGGFTQQIRQRSGPAWGNVDATPALMEAALVQLAAWGWGVVRLEYRPDDSTWLSQTRCNKSLSVQFSRSVTSNSFATSLTAARQTSTPGWRQVNARMTSSLPLNALLHRLLE